MILKKDDLYILDSAIESIDTKNKPITFNIKTISGAVIESSIYSTSTAYNNKLQELKTNQNQNIIIDI